MKRLIAVICVLFLLALSVVFAITLTREQKQHLQYCQQDCLSEKRDRSSLCQTQSKACQDSCKVDFNLCVDNIETVQNACTENCESTYEMVANATDNRTQLMQAKRDFLTCKRTCITQGRESRKNDCNIAPCRVACLDAKKACDIHAKNNDSACLLGCFDYVINKEYLFNETNSTSTNSTQNPPFNQTTNQSAETNQSIELNDTIELNETIDLNDTIDINDSIALNGTIDFNATQLNGTQVNETHVPEMNQTIDTDQSEEFNNTCELMGIRNPGCAVV